MNSSGVSCFFALSTTGVVTTGGATVPRAPGQSFLIAFSATPNAATSSFFVSFLRASAKMVLGAIPPPIRSSISSKNCRERPDNTSVTSRRCSDEGGRKASVGLKSGILSSRESCSVVVATTGVAAGAAAVSAFRF